MNENLGNNEIEKTSLYSLNDFEDSLVSSTIKEVCASLKEKGYNEINQLVGYIMSGDPGYISSHNDARNKIRAIERDELLEKLVKYYIGIDE